MIDFEPHLDDSKSPKIPLPEGWPEVALAAVLHIIAEARLHSEVELLKQELAIKDARFAAIDPQRCPRYTPRQRLAIQVLKSARDWSTTQVSKRFHVTVQTIRNWMQASTSLVELPEKVTRCPDYLRFIVQQLKVWCPILGRQKIADILARTGLHISSRHLIKILIAK